MHPPETRFAPSYNFLLKYESFATKRPGFPQQLRKSRPFAIVSCPVLFGLNHCFSPVFWPECPVFGESATEIPCPCAYSFSEHAPIAEMDCSCILYGSKHWHRAKRNSLEYTTCSRKGRNPSISSRAPLCTFSMLQKPRSPASRPTRRRVCWQSEKPHKRSGRFPFWSVSQVRR